MIAFREPLPREQLKGLQRNFYKHRFKRPTAGRSEELNSVDQARSRTRRAYAAPAELGSLKWLEDGKHPLDWNGPTSRLFTKFPDEDISRPIIAHFERVARQHRNAGGAITGYYNEANLVIRGFVREPDGKITSFDPPGSISTRALSINSRGAITGYYQEANMRVHGFVQRAGGTILSFDPPESTGTFPASINFTRSRKAFTCVGVHSSQRITGTSVMPSLRAAFSRRCPSTISPSLRRRQGFGL